MLTTQSWSVSTVFFVLLFQKSQSNLVRATEIEEKGPAKSGSFSASAVCQCTFSELFSILSLILSSACLATQVSHDHLAMPPAPKQECSILPFSCLPSPPRRHILATVNNYFKAPCNLLAVAGLKASYVAH